MRCPHCDHILSDEWLKKVGASLMGKKGGAAKARSREQTQAAARSRWGTQPLRTAEELREINRLRQRKYQATHRRQESV